MQNQLEALETELDIMIKWYVAMFSRFAELERGKYFIQTQLAATET
jgi:hypothetical protein